MNRILLVGTTLFPRMILCELLEQNGYGVEFAENVPQALATLENLSIDLVITEFAMPRMSGTDLIQTMKERNGLPDIPVIVLIYPWHSKEAIVIKQAGAFKIMTAPYNYDELVVLVGEAIKEASLRKNGNPHHR